MKVNEKVYSINFLYRPPYIENQDSFLTACEIILQKLNSHPAETRLVISDLNFGNCYSKRPILCHKPLDSTAPEIFESHGFTQVIDIPTRMTNDTVSLIDLIFIDNLDSVTRHGTLPKIADHDGVFITFHRIKQKQCKPCTRTIYNYKDIDETGLINFMKNFDFETTVFSKPTTQQADCMTNILSEFFSKFVPSKQVLIRPQAPAWSNTYTRLLQRRKNRNYTFYKQAKTKYMTVTSNPDSSQDTITTFFNKQARALVRSNESRNNSTNANKRAKAAFYNTVNSTMNNPSISAKKKFGILKTLMKNQKISTIPPLIENNETITDPKQKAEILNAHFAAKSNIQGVNDEVPFLDDKENIFSELSNMNTSPIEISKIIRT